MSWSVGDMFFTRWIQGNTALTRSQNLENVWSSLKKLELCMTLPLCLSRWWGGINVFWQHFWYLHIILVIHQTIFALGWNFFCSLLDVKHMTPKPDSIKGCGQFKKRQLEFCASAWQTKSLKVKWTRKMLPRKSDNKVREKKKKGQKLWQKIRI